MTVEVVLIKNTDKQPVKFVKITREHHLKMIYLTNYERNSAAKRSNHDSHKDSWNRDMCQKNRDIMTHDTRLSCVRQKTVTMTRMVKIADVTDKIDDVT